MTAPLQARGRSARDHARVVLGRGVRRYDRAVAALNLLDSVIPGFAHRWATWALAGKRLPLRCGRLSPLGYGSGDTVFATVPGPGFDLVCKVQRQSVGQKLSDLLTLARDRETAFREIVRQYGEVADVFPYARFLIMHGPMFGVPAVVCLQQLVKGATRDVLYDLEPAELRRLLAKRPRFRAQVVAFFARTIEAWEKGELIVDLGRQNLLAVGTTEDLRLVYLDVEMHEVAWLKRSRLAGMYEAHVETMRRTLRELARDESGSVPRGGAAAALPARASEA